MITNFYIQYGYKAGSNMSKCVTFHMVMVCSLSLSLSAGVGRTGTFITIDHVLEQVMKENVVDIPGVINRIRQERMKLVQKVVSMN